MKEFSFLYIAYDEYDNAAGVMMTHPDAWEHISFKDVCVKVANVEVYYKALNFYLQDLPRRSTICSPCSLRGWTTRVWWT